MRFCPWYPLADAAAHVPPGPGVLQLRLAAGLVDYPGGKSAMVRYAAGDDLPAVARGLAAALAGRALWCRHLVEVDPAAPVDPVAYCARLVEDFARRFGAAPRLPPG